MINKNTFVGFGILAVLLMSLGMVSAVNCLDIIPVDIPTSVNHDVGTIDFTFNVSHAGGSCGNKTNIEITFNADKSGTFSTFSSFNLSKGDADKTINAQFNLEKYQNGDIIITVNQEYSEGTESSDNLPPITITPTPELTITPITNLTKTTNGTIKVENTGNVNLQNISLQKTTSADFDVQFNDSDFALTAGQSKLVKVSSTDAKNLDFKDKNSLKIKATNGSLDSNEITLTVDSFFYDGNNDGELDVSIDRIDVKKGYGDDENFWYPFDDIELKIIIDNNGAWDIENIELRLCLLDVEKNKCVFDEDDMEIDEDDFDIDGGDDNSILINFNVDPRNLKKGNTEYILYVSAVGKIDDSDSNYDGDETGASTFKNIKIRTNEEFVIFNQVTLTDSSGYDGETSCGSKITLSANVWNIGDKDLDDDKIFVLVYNKELGISKIVSFNDGISSMDWELLETTFTIPSNATEKTYIIKLTAYDDDNLADKHIYKNKEDDKSEFYQSLKVTKCKASSIAQPTISANLESEAKVGEELIIKVIITNNDEDNDFIISLSDFSTWATLVSITPQTASINKGEFTELTIILKPTTTGEHSFNINTIVNGESYSQPVSVNIAKESGIFAKIDNTTLYVITGIVVILIVIALVLIVKLSRRRARPEF